MYIYPHAWNCWGCWFFFWRSYVVNFRLLIQGANGISEVLSCFDVFWCDGLLLQDSYAISWHNKFPKPSCYVFHSFIIRSCSIFHRFNSTEKEWFRICSLKHPKLNLCCYEYFSSVIVIRVWFLIAAPSDRIFHRDYCLGIQTCS